MNGSEGPIFLGDPQKGVGDPSSRFAAGSEGVWVSKALLTGLECLVRVRVRGKWHINGTTNVGTQSKGQIIGPWILDASFKGRITRIS